MKKWTATFVLLIVVVSFVGCHNTPDAPASISEPDGVLRQSPPTNEEIDRNIAVLKEPPMLTVVYGDTTGEALRGTTSWNYQNEDGTDVSLESDSMHPLQAKEYMTPIDLIPSHISSAHSFEAFLQWDTAPDRISVSCWSEEFWNQPAAASEEIPVNMFMIDSNFETKPVISIELKDGNYIYEVVSEWTGSEKYGGTARYSFYTITSNVESQSMDSQILMVRGGR